MSKFQNKLCPVCREKFKPGDDIAVCPDCGTPHHRACYLKNNKCALEDLHSRNFVWNGRLPDEPIPVPDIAAFIQNIKDDEEEAERAGAFDDLNSADNIEDDEKSLKLLGLDGLTEDQLRDFREAKSFDSVRELLDTIRDNTRGDDGVSMQELIAYTGTSVWHYAKAFNSFRGTGIDRKKHYIYFNVCSGLLSPVYQFYRKMNLLGMITLLISLIPSAVVTLNGGDSAVISPGTTLLMNMITLLPMILLCLFGDYLFYLKAVKHIIKIRRKFNGSTDSLEYIKVLSDHGRPSLPRALICCLAKVFLSACLLAYASGAINI